MAASFGAIDVPEIIGRDGWCRALNELGIPTHALRSITADPRTITLTFLAEVDGKKVAIGDGLATITHTIPIR